MICLGLTLSATEMFSGHEAAFVVVHAVLAVVSVSLAVAAARPLLADRRGRRRAPA